MTDYIEELNENQREAVLYNEGASLVIAGAGSGKTRVLTYKIAYLLESGYKPWSILALTFTNKAAREMKERIAQQVGERQARYLWMGTFHSVFSRILRTEAGHIGFTSNFTIYDTSDSRSLIRAIIKELQLDEKVYKPGMVQARISNAKNRLIAPSAYKSDKETVEYDRSQKLPALGDIYQRYWERCRQAGAMDFDDLLFYTYLLFNNHPEVLEKYREQFQFVLVDEYQDTNYAQHTIILQLTEQHQKVCVVGDDAQSIYSFRGANIDNILKFTELYKNARIFKLEQNYRSTQNIVGAANSLIEKNQHQIPKEVFSQKSNGELIQVFQAYSDVEEGEIVGNKIVELHRKKSHGYDGFAILYRTNAQSRIFEEALRKRSVPYKIYGGLSFYQRKEIKDVIAYFRLAINPHDEEAFKRVINYPTRGIGATTLTKIIDVANRESISLWEVISKPSEWALSVNKGTLTKLKGFHSLIAGFIQDAVEKNAYDMSMDIIRHTGIRDDIYQDKTPENLSRQENVEELLNGIYEFCRSRQEEGNEHVLLADFLAEVSLLTDQDTDQEGDNEKVTLMTIHSAKGLEFRNVFIVGLEENLFPNAMSLGSYRELEEERRLFYVALTRAEENCFLSFAKSRYRYGKQEFCNPSRFLKDIDVCYLEPVGGDESLLSKRITETRARLWDNHSAGKRTGTAQISVTETPVSEEENRNFKKVSEIRGRKSTPSIATTGLQEGQVIEHERFGIGDVVRIEGTGENTKATVKFRNAGEKQLLLKFARFKIIG